MESKQMEVKMKTKLFKLAILLPSLTLISARALTGQELASTGIGLRGIHWNITEESQVEVNSNLHGAHVKVSGYGGSIFFFSRISKQFLFDFTLSGIGMVENNVEYWYGENVEAGGVAPILLGIRYLILPAENKSVLQPYLETGAGAYLINNVRVEDRRLLNETVAVESYTRPGVYLGAGLNFMLSRAFAINYNMRYHLVDFRNDIYQSGIEIGFGFSIMWGDFN
jgi:hypothetical protein